MWDEDHYEEDYHDEWDEWEKDRLAEDFAAEREADESLEDDGYFAEDQHLDGYDEPHGWGDHYEGYE